MFEALQSTECCYGSAYRELKKCPPLLNSIVETFKYDSSASPAHSYRQLGLLHFATNEVDTFVAVACIMHENAAEVVEDSNTVGLALFSKACMMSHSCDANCFWYTKWSTGGSAFERIVRAIKDIRPGQELTVSYALEGILILPTPERRAWIRRNFSFECNCVRCTSHAEYVRCFYCASPPCTGRMHAYISQDSAELVVGRHAVIVGLLNTSELNGSTCALERYVESSAR